MFELFFFSFSINYYNLFDKPGIISLLKSTFKIFEEDCNKIISFNTKAVLYSNMIPIANICIYDLACKSKFLNVHQ